MEYKITGYKPEKLFHFFEEVCAVPRGSGNEKGISDFLVKFAKDRGLWVYQDDSYNVIIKKNGSEGAEDKEPVMLQGHIDMVCDKRAGVEHDFETEGIDLVLKDGVLSANGKVDPEKLEALIFDQFQHGYYVSGERVGKAWNAGAGWMKKC